MSDCIFCKIARGEYNTDFLFEDEQVVAFKDINPQAPIHVLVIPKKHYTSVKDLDDEPLMGHLITAAKKVAEKLGLSDFRIVVNTGSKAGQTVFHLHVHVLGGRYLSWPPG
ncbi:MAG: histidine triad nucleotide-binding protein [bacterium]|nr:histidine triad nucleotide-binding protein [bacterium]